MEQVNFQVSQTCHFSLIFLSSASDLPEYRQVHLPLCSEVTRYLR
uniref:Uncharacterized protein n=1 Tax=Arundo donax TaxID=35708 RepID=A0A0A9FSP0_ARUDO